MNFQSAIVRLFLSNSVFFQMNVNAISAEGLLRLYRGEDDYVDATGNGPTLTGNGPNSGFATDTPYGSSSRRVMSFNIGGSTDSWASASDSGLPTGDSSRTLMGWSKPPTASGAWYTNVPFAYGSGAQTQFGVYFYGTDGNTFGVDYWAVTENINPINTITPGSGWYHFVLSYDQATGTLKGYVNGVLEKSSTNDPPNTGSDLFVLARSVPGLGDYYRGYLADVALFDRALSDAEVASIYSASEGLTSTCSSNSDCTSNFCGGDNICTDGSNRSSCLDSQSCSSTFCVSSLCRDGAIGSPCASGSDCSSTFCVSGSCNDGAIGSPCASGSDCSSTFCVSGSCADGALGSPCSSGSNCSSTICESGFCTDIGASCTSGSDCSSSICVLGFCRDGALGSQCATGSDCFTGYCSPTSSTCAAVPILDPCHGISCSKHGKCKGNGICQCENTFIQTNDGKDCACPEGSILNASANRCFAPTASPTLSPTSLPVTSSPTLLVTSEPTGSPTIPFETPVCEDDSSYKFELKIVAREVGCSWISKNRKRKDRRRARYCTEDFDNGALITACKKSCNSCAVY